MSDKKENPIAAAALKQPSAGVDERASLATLVRFVDAVRECYHLASSYSGSLDGVDEHGGDDHEDPICAVFHRLYYAMFDGEKALEQVRAQLAAPAGVPDGLGITQDQIDRHTTTAWECPPQSLVVLVSSLKRLAGKNAAAPSPAPAHSENAAPVPAGWLRFDDDQRAIFTRSKRGKDAQPLYPHPTPYRVQKTASDVVQVERAELRGIKAKFEFVEGRPWLRSAAAEIVYEQISELLNGGRV